MRYPLAVSTWDDAELRAIQEVAASGHFTMGPRVRQFEQEFASYFGSKYAVMVNSGSSANLLAVASQFYRSHPTLRRGDEVIVPALSWSTTYYPLQQYGLRLRFVDIDPDTLNLPASRVEEAITANTRGIFAVNILGAPNDFASLQRICKEHDLLLLEDNCESMGAQFEGRYTGTFGECGTFSTFFSHHICTMEGGVVVTDSEEVYHTLLSLRAHGWTRDLPDRNCVFHKTGDPFEDSYRFVLPGYNVRPLEVSGAIGSCQLSKLADFNKARLRNAEHLQRAFSHIGDIALQKPLGESSWFAFAFILKGRLQGRRRDLTSRLTDAGIECRPIVGGNFVKNPVVKYLEYSVNGELTTTEYVDENGFYIGNHPLDLREQIDLTATVVAEFLNGL